MDTKQAIHQVFAKAQQHEMLNSLLGLRVGPTGPESLRLSPDQLTLPPVEAPCRMMAYRRAGACPFKEATPRREPSDLHGTVLFNTQNTNLQNHMISMRVVRSGKVVKSN